MLHVQHKNWQSLPRPLAALSSIQIMQLVVPKATEIVAKMDLMWMKKEALSTQFPALAAIKKFENERNSKKYIFGFLSLSLSLSVKRWQIVKESFVGGKTEKFRTELNCRVVWHLAQTFPKALLLCADKSKKWLRIQNITLCTALVVNSVYTRTLCQLLEGRFDFKWSRIG